MTTVPVDLAVVGSGFAGSLLSLIARQIGLRVALLERGSHPRFALGESTTPLSNLILADLARRYRLPRLFERVHYGSWKRARPDLRVGLKRGFTFFRHREGQPLGKGAFDRLLVEASDRDEVADVQWFRESFDEFLVGEAIRSGVFFLDRTEVELEKGGDPIRLVASREGERYRLQARLLVDASGDGRFLGKAFSIPERAGATKQRQASTVFGHFRDVKRIAPVLERAGHPVGLFPFRCDDAAVHHIFDGGWMWHLRFDDGLVSAGFLFDQSGGVDGADGDPRTVWKKWISRFPTLWEIYRGAGAVGPVRRQERVCRFLERAAGPNWILLPHAAYFVDPLLSGGIPHSLSVVEQLGLLLEKGLSRTEFSEELEGLGRQLLEEAEGLDELVYGCYRSFRRFDLFSSFVMHYFVAATSLEAARRGKDCEANGAGFLRMRDGAFRKALKESSEEMENLLLGRAGAKNPEAFARGLAARLAPWNREGFCNPSAGNLYRSPVRPREVYV